MDDHNAPSPATTRQDHPDNKGVFVELWVLDLVDGDHVAALLLSQVLWWHVPGKNGRPKIHFQRKGYRWLIRSDDDWMPECRLSVRQVRRVRRSLVEKGLVITARFRVDGVPLMAWRPNYDVLDPEVTDSRSDAIASLHGSTPSASLHGSSAIASLPIPSVVPHKETSTTTSPVARPQPSPDGFDTFWSAYPLHRAPADARKAWDKAVKRTTPEVIIAGADRFAEECRVRGVPKDRRPYPATWLNRESWDDEAIPPPAMPVNGHRPSPVERGLANLARTARALEDQENGQPQSDRRSRPDAIDVDATRVD